jgi:hypothetical protein
MIALNHFTGYARNAYTYGTNIGQIKAVSLTQISTKRKWKIIKHAVGVVILQCTVLALGNFKIVYAF